MEDSGNSTDVSYEAPMTTSSIEPEDQTFREFGAQVIRASLHKMLSHAGGVRSGTDIVAVHDMRVASRRLRAAITVFGPAFSGGSFRRFERDVKAVTDELSLARDLDVMIDTLMKLESTLAPGEQAGIEQFVQEKQAERSHMQNAVDKALDRMEKRDLSAQFDEVATRFISCEPGEPAGIADAGHAAGPAADKSREAPVNAE